MGRVPVGTGMLGDDTPMVPGTVATGGMVGTIVDCPVGIGNGIVGQGGGIVIVTGIDGVPIELGVDAVGITVPVPVPATVGVVPAAPSASRTDRLGRHVLLAWRPAPGGQVVRPEVWPASGLHAWL
jgi:hypothetical protein